jgi:hypothetical protein
MEKMLTWDAASRLGNVNTRGLQIEVNEFDYNSLERNRRRICHRKCADDPRGGRSRGFEAEGRNASGEGKVVVDCLGNVNNPILPFPASATNFAE